MSGTLIVYWPLPAAQQCCPTARGLDAMIRIGVLRLAVEPIDVLADTERLLARVVQVFGTAQSHHAYLFANARHTPIKLLILDGLGVWCAALRLNEIINWCR
ncbi:IS66 family insertion sequence element accessory protein TnpB [Cupriavidus sp. DF5525]|uniref:IS66 family insertion sequence element accessory protein TnpB n=1 Tax=Cupriavidus sp. DF5525 TaxID=3160989 RepID=UPI0026C20969